MATYPPSCQKPHKNIYFRNKEEQLDFYKSKGANGWVADLNGTNTAGWGLSLTTMDMAKLGQLYLNEGYWNGRQIISDKWIVESTQVQSVWKARHLKYGYLWWVIELWLPFPPYLFQELKIGLIS